MEPRLIHKDRNLLVIDKPANMPSTDVEGGTQDTLVRWIIKNFPNQKKLKKPAEAGLVHRLDNATSGVIVAARNDKAYEYMRNLWEKRDVIKEYLCLVLGQAPPAGRIHKLIAHHPEKQHKMMTVENTGDVTQLKGRYAETEFKALEYFPDYAYLSIKITTGVRHQIRCHMASIGYPIAGDALYQRTRHAARDWLNLPRHFLHASKVGFVHPASRKYVEYASPLPDDLQNALHRLRCDVAGKYV